jgi:uncharacterized protein
MTTRRVFLTGLGGLGLVAAGIKFWPDEGLTNPCRDPVLPGELARHDLVLAAWEGLDSHQVWDSHVHLVGIGDSDSGTWVSPQTQSLLHPIQFAQFRFYLNAACVGRGTSADLEYLQRLIELHHAFPPGVRLLLLAFDFYHDTAGQPVKARSAFYTPNAYAARVAHRYPDLFEWVASIHPYRIDCVAALHQAVRGGARAIKWLPPAMEIDPSSPRCDTFYEALAQLDLPLISHAGDEQAVHGAGAQWLGNPLLLRRALEHGVRVIVAHCASLGSNIDIDQGQHGPKRSNFDLFARMMDEPRYEGHLFGEISAMTQINRLGPPLYTVLKRDDWHHRLINGSDYPLPGVMPLFSMDQLVGQGYVDAKEARVFSAIRQHNPLLFDFVLKRHLKAEGKRFSAQVFHSRRLFEREQRFTRPTA